MARTKSQNQIIRKTFSFSVFTEIRVIISFFTLVELLVVIATISILLSILLPALKKSREKAMHISCVSNLKQFSHAGMSYVNDNDGWLPIYGGHDSYYQWHYQLHSYLNYDWANRQTRSDFSIFHCPLGMHWAEVYSAYQSRGYGYNRELAVNSNNSSKLANMQTPTIFVLIGDFWRKDVPHWELYVGGTANNHPFLQTANYNAFRHSNKMNILFADSHVESRLPYNPAGTTPNNTRWINNHGIYKDGVFIAD